MIVSPAMRLPARALLLSLALALPLPSAAQAATPAGLWQTSDDQGRPDGLVRIVARDGGFDATVEAVFSPPAPSAQPRCELCPGELKDRPVVGLRIASGLKADGEGWSGEILDPDDGRRYRCTLRLAEGGRRLEVRGYIGLPLFGRTQTWTRKD
jgi:uncharacterized protein (DUF2147 family)